jgi:hypothetical protein
LEARMVVASYNPHVRLLSPGPWLVGTTKVYPGVGADIVMESITLIDPAVGVLSAKSRRVIGRVRRRALLITFDSPLWCGLRSGLRITIKA